VLDLVQSAFNPMLGRIRPTLIIIASFLLFLEATRIAIRCLAGVGNPKWELLLFGIKSSIVLFLLLSGFGSVFNAIYKTAVLLGLQAGGDVIAVKDFLDPGQYIHLGLAASAPLWEKIRLSTVLSTDPTGIGFFFAWLCCVGAYVALAFTIFIAQVELSVGLIGTAVILPFLLYHPTHWMAQGTISYPINKAFRFFILAVLASAMFPIIRDQLTLVATPRRTLWQILTTYPDNPADSMQQAWILIIATWAMALLYMKTSSIASGILSGRPSLTGSMAMHAAIGTAATVGGLGDGVVTGGLIAAGHGAGGVVRTPSASSPVPGSRSPASFAGGAAAHRHTRSAGLSHAGGAVVSGLISGARYLSHD